MKEMMYQMIFKRKSFHLFKDIGTISDSELEEIRQQFTTFQSLVGDVSVELKIVRAEKTSCKHGEEYGILLYSEQKNGYLQNIGYLGE